MIKLGVKIFLLLLVASALFYFLDLELSHSILSDGRLIKPNEVEAIKEKAGQLFIVGFEGKEPTPENLKFIQELRPGGVLLLSRNIENKEQVKRLIFALQQESIKITGLPLLVAVDQEGGQVCRLYFLDCAAPAEIQNEDQAFELGRKRGQELAELGVNLNLAPVLDEAFEGDAIYNRTFQAPLDKAGKLAAAFISGQQSAGILNAVKHFPGYGRISFNPERDRLPVLDSLPQTNQFALFHDREITQILMLANVVYKENNTQLPFSFTKEGVSTARRIVSQEGFIISDDLSSKVLKAVYGLQDTIKNAYTAGLDILIVAGFDDIKDPALAISALKDSFEKGEFSKEELKSKIEKIIKLKQELCPRLQIFCGTGQK